MKNIVRVVIKKTIFLSLCVGLSVLAVSQYNQKEKEKHAVSYTIYKLEKQIGGLF